MGTSFCWKFKDWILFVCPFNFTTSRTCICGNYQSY